MKTFAASALPSTIVALMHVLVAGSNTNKHDETDKTKTSQTYDIYESLGLIQKTLHQIKEEVKYQTNLKMGAHSLTPSHGTLQSDVKSRMQLEATPRPGQSKEKLQSEGNGEDGSFIRRQPRMTTAAARRYVRKMNKLLLRTGVQTQCPWPDNVMDDDSEDGGEGGGNGSEHSYLSTSSESIPSTTKFIDEEEEGEPGQQQENADDKENADPASVAEVVLSQNDTPTTTTRARSVKTKKIQILPLDLSGENTEVERARMKRAQLKRLRKL